MGKFFYAVHAGRTPGIYTEWYGDGQAESQVHGYKGAQYKKFKTMEEAERFMQTGHAVGKPVAAETVNEDGFPENYAFTDGSFNSETGVYGYGGFLMHGEEQATLQGSGDDPEWAASRNVAGEVLGAMAAVKEAEQAGLSELTIYYDYMGVEYWATGEWKTNKVSTQNYAAFMRKASEKMRISFCHVKAHTGIPGNDAADRLAKEAVGLE